MDLRTREILQIDVIWDRLATRAAGPLGKSYIHDLTPLGSLPAIEARSAIIRDLITLIEHDGALPLGGLQDLTEPFKMARVDGSMLPPEYWPPIVRLLEVLKEVSSFAARQGETYHHLCRMIRDLEDHVELRTAVTNTFDDSGEIRDQASPMLSSLRNQRRGAERSLLRTVEKMVGRLYNDGVLQDDFSTVRHGRHVFPVKASSRSRIPGVLHGRSSTGETLYIEPLEVVEANNQIETLSEEEQQEIRRILVSLTAKLRPLVGLLKANLETLGAVDGLQAVARIANEFGWNMPIMVEEGALRLYKAHHPLLNLESPKDSVPVTMIFDKDDRCIIFSGPNAGGKTTAMKSIATLALIAQCGLPIPAFPDSTLPLFDNILADIGDQQDIQAGLSTFSGHIRRIKELWFKAHRRSLVVLDELGTGTDPQEGTALALALLEGFRHRARLTITTSHLNPVKQWASDTKGVRNASFSLDAKTRQPTYRLRLDLPGASEALEIAEREGFPSEVLSHAKQLVGDKHLQMGDLIRRVEEKERALATALKEAEARAEGLAEQEEVLRARADLLRDERRQLREKSVLEREKVVGETRDKIERLIADLPSEDELARRREALVRAREEALKESNLTAGERRRLAEEQEYRGVHFVGERVYIRSLGGWGEIVELDIPRSRARVQVGIMQATVTFAELIDHDPDERRREQIHKSEEMALPRSARKKRKQQKSRRIKNALRDAEEYTPPSNVPMTYFKGVSVNAGSRPESMTLDLHGFRVEEAIAEMDRYLDRSLLANFPYVKICHGTGTGRLYRAVHEYLRGHRSVKKFRFATPDEGGGGVTVVDL